MIRLISLGDLSVVFNNNNEILVYINNGSIKLLKDGSEISSSVGLCNILKYNVLTQNFEELESKIQFKGLNGINIEIFLKDLLNIKNLENKLKSFIFSLGFDAEYDSEVLELLNEIKNLYVLNLIDDSLKNRNLDEFLNLTRMLNS